MINFLFKIMLTFNSTSLLVIIFLVQKGITINYLEKFSYFDSHQNQVALISYLIYFLVPLFLTKLSLNISSKLSQDEFKSCQIKNIENANDSFLPSYLGYFFVGLSVGSFDALFFVYFVLFIFTLMSKSLYYNPFILIWGFNFYHIDTKSGTKIFLISRNSYKIPDELNIKAAYRINNYTFIELKVNNESDSR